MVQLHFLVTVKLRDTNFIHIATEQTARQNSTVQYNTKNQQQQPNITHRLAWAFNGDKLLNKYWVYNAAKTMLTDLNIICRVGFLPWH